MRQGCRLFKRCWNLPSGQCVAGVQGVSVVLEPTSPVLLGSGACCLSSVRTTSRALLGQGCRLFNRGLNLPPGHCWAGVQAG